jgi:formate dehydrogenase subunit delta
MDKHDMIRMANQIASFFNGSGPEVAVRDVAEHINKFWDPRMRTALIAHLATDGEGLDPTILKTKGQIKPPKLAEA